LADSTDNSPDLTGTKIGEYEVMSRLGLGGMGVVYEGRQPLIGKRVAIKILLPQLSADRELVERFISEARAVNEIGHRGIVDIFSFGMLVTGQHYFVMEYLDGMPFDKLIKTRSPIPPVEALWWIEEVCEALHGAHEAGIIHRDIKPSNLFLVDTGRGRPYVKLLDFGIAKLGAIKGEATPQTRASVVVGTPDYMSPEQARGQAISPQTDVYALGCVLFELLTGKRPFKGENALQTMFMHVENPAPKLSAFVPGLPPELDDLLLWTMEKDPALRPPSTDELRAHLEEIRASLPEMAPRSSPTRSALGSSPGTPASTTPHPSGSRRSLSGSVPAMSPPRPTTGPRRTLSGSMPAMSPPPPRRPTSPSMKALPSVPVDIAFTGEQAPVQKLESVTKVLPSMPIIQGVQEQAAAPVHPESSRGVAPTVHPESSRGAAPAVHPESSRGVAPAVHPESSRGAPVDDDEDDYQSRGGKGPWVVAFLVLAGLGAFGYFKYLRPKAAIVEETPKPVEPPPVAIVDPTPPVVEPLVVAPPVVEPPPEAPKPPPETPKPPVKKPPVAVVKKPPPVKPPPATPAEPETPAKKPSKGTGGITTDTINARIEKYEGKLAEKERASGNADREVRQMLLQAHGLADQAETDAQRKNAWKYLDDIQKRVEAP
jgi:serine/threonine-protein kinase